MQNVNRVSDPSDCFVSIQLNSNRPQQILTFLQNVQSTATHPEQVEVLIHIDSGDTTMEEALDIAIATMLLSIKYIATDIVSSFFDLWKPLNELIKLTDPAVYFVINVSDEFLFETQGWDELLRRYVGYYPDDIFRIRTSQYRYRNYHDVWECGFAPDSLAFYTKRWLDISGDWNPCLGPDSFQQCVAYYLYSHDRFNMNQCNRDIADPFIKFSGEGANIGLEGEALKKRSYGHIKEWFVLMSAKMQEEAKRRAMLLRAQIFVEEHGISTYTIKDNRTQKRIEVKDTLIDPIRIFPYHVRPLKICFVNFLRRFRYHFYNGGGENAVIESWFGGTLFYLSYKSKFFEKVYKVFEETKVGKSFIGYRYGKNFKRYMTAFNSSLKSRKTGYYVYGTGNYALTLLDYIEWKNIAKPRAIFEKESIIKSKKDLPEFKGYQIISEERGISALTESDIILIGSYSFADIIIARLQDVGCKARLVKLTY